ncbi:MULTISPECIES: NUDIX domain-containing protein [Pseudomonas]|jgi:isopentenyl-diphosphate delta-isomerase|uniref:NUDIX hydrolase n=1 Tax=Pseudomonas soli TaxID=1306993 RepID=A0A2V4HNI5_9PSED|nr:MULTISPECIES: NUDIX domain-containing protein [Pseudomonas]PYB75904.1 NUDIX hydrolase [Pseudomonas soli]PZW73821.1 isopentenyl-diphosphate delta-isomerase [Pseudomonas sp. 2848]QWA27909.1 NUDIX domain-containing protein [Pseudomonas sp. RC3H12]
MPVNPAEVAHRAASDAELVAWVDEHDQLLGALPRAELRERGLIGRCTFILLFNSAGDLCVHRRTLSKALYPGYWDVAAGGMVGVQESYAESAARELAEELGVSGVELRFHETFPLDLPGNRLWCAVFSAVWDGALRLQPEEVSEARFIKLARLELDFCRSQLCPDSLLALERYMAGIQP